MPLPEPLPLSEDRFPWRYHRTMGEVWETNELLAQPRLSERQMARLRLLLERARRNNPPPEQGPGAA